MRNPAFVRISSRFDYALDVCKDYKDSGYCGFGDSCKFMHDRTDYKAGWEIERDYLKAKSNLESKQTENYEIPDQSDSEESESDSLPLNCLLCRMAFTNPIITKCGHYFCESCALRNFLKSPKCACCGANTLGIFNVAKDLIRKIAEKRAKMEEQEKQVRKLNFESEEQAELEEHFNHKSNLDLPNSEQVFYDIDEEIDSNSE